MAMLGKTAPSALLLAACLAAPLALAQAPAPSPPDTPEVQAHVDKALAMAGGDIKGMLFLCRADSAAVAAHDMDWLTDWIEPTKLFDNLYFVGNHYVSSLIVKTSQGLIVIDSGNSTEDAVGHMVPDMLKLGLDPKDIKYLIISHGHPDHYGGAAYLQDTYHPRVGMSAGDWAMIEAAAAANRTGGRKIPTRDMVVTDGQALTLGDTTIRFYVTPGHTIAPLSAIIPAREGGKTYMISQLGSVGFPGGLGPTPNAAGMLAYHRSLLRFIQISKDAGAVGHYNTHTFADDSLDRIRAAQTRKPGQPNPFLTGPASVSRLYGVMDECLQAAILRAHGVPG